MMDALIESIPPLLVGLCFTPLGALKLYGLYKGYEGSPTKALWERLRAGSCAEEHCRVPKRWRIPFWFAFDVLLLGVGLYNLTRFFIVVAT